MAKVPIYLELNKSKVVIIGNSSPAIKYFRFFKGSGARLVVVTELLTPSLEDVCEDDNPELIISTYSRHYLSGAFLVIAATISEEMNSLIEKDCEQLDILCHNIDNFEASDFMIPDIIKCSNILMALSHSGSCTEYYNYILDKLRKMFTPAHESFLRVLDNTCRQMITEIPNPRDRAAITSHLVRDESFAYFRSRGPQAWSKRAKCLFGHKYESCGGSDSTESA
jgi:siroheme synthase-like protein